MDVRKMCRTCLSDNQDSLKSIYLKATVAFNIAECAFSGGEKMRSQLTDSVMLVDMLDECFKPISKISGAGMPELLCAQCEVALIDAYVFRKRCENAMNQLLKFIDGYVIKRGGGPVHGGPLKTNGTDVDAVNVQCEELLDGRDLVDTEMMEKFTAKSVHDDELALSGSHAVATEAVNDTSHATRRRHACDECSKEFSRATHLKRHMMIHSDERPFTCAECGKSFRRADHLQMHQKSHDDIKPHECEYCSRGFTRAEHLRNHIWTQHTEGTDTAAESTKQCVCTLCGRTFATNKCLNAHKKSHSERIVECKFCAKKFRTGRMLSEHIKTHANEKQYLCSECGLTFVRNDYLVVHMRRHKGERPYKCKYCSKGFPRATDLKVHERYHTGEKRHHCTMCGKGFQRAYNLVVHMRVHTGERPYKCPQCPKSFAQGNDLKAHSRRHTGERYRCDVCGEGFIQGYHLTQHKQSAHGIDMLSHCRRVEKIHPPHLTSSQIERDQPNRRCADDK